MVNEMIKQAEERMKKSIQALRSEFVTVRTGRASASLIDKVMIDYYGTETAVSQVATVSVPEARLLLIQPWDKGLIEPIEKAILKSSLGLNPSNDGNVIRVPVPQLNEERRKELVKMVKSMAEEAKVAVRNIRRDMNDSFKSSEKSGQISEDDMRRLQSEIQKMTDKFIAEIDEMVKHKEEEIMEV